MVNRYDFPYVWRKGCSLVLAFFWIAGWVCGIWTSRSADFFFLSQMRGACLGAVSIVSVLLVSFLPFLFSALAVSCHRTFLLLFVAFWKAFLSGYVSFGLVQAFPVSGWLLRPMLLFSEIASLPLLYGYWRKHLCGRVRPSGWETAAYLSVFFLIGSIDFRIISPFLASLIDS